VLFFSFCLGRRNNIDQGYEDFCELRNWQIVERLDRGVLRGSSLENIILVLISMPGKLGVMPSMRVVLLKFAGMILRYAQGLWKVNLGL
jgi:hypothetical protein